MLDRYDSFNGTISIVYRCDKLLIIGYRYAQEVDLNVGEMIYLLRRVVFVKFMPNEQILTEKYMKIVKSANLIGFLNRLAKYSK